MHDQCPGPGQLSEIVAGVYAWVQPDGSWWLNNTGAVTGDGDDGTHPAGTFVVDTSATFERTRAFLDAVAAATDGTPITIAANTHQHGDHTYGNSVLPAEAVIIGHEAHARRAARRPDHRRLPARVVAGAGVGGGDAPRALDRGARPVTVFNGTRRIDLHHPGYAAHTTGDLIAWLPDERVLFSGDLFFHGLTPLVFMGSVGGARRSLDWLASFDPAHVVPGHGVLFGGAQLADVLGRARPLLPVRRARRRRRPRGGAAPLDAARDAATTRWDEFAGWSDAERIVLNLHRAYADAEGRELDLFTAIFDAVTYNGGPMTTHVCCAPSTP